MGLWFSWTYRCKQKQIELYEGRREKGSPTAVTRQWGTLSLVGFTNSRLDDLKNNSVHVEYSNEHSVSGDLATRSLPILLIQCLACQNVGCQQSAGWQTQKSYDS